MSPIWYRGFRIGLALADNEIKWGTSCLAIFWEEFWLFCWDVSWLDWQIIGLGRGTYSCYFHAGILLILHWRFKYSAPHNTTSGHVVLYTVMFFRHSFANSPLNSLRLSTQFFAGFCIRVIFSNAVLCLADLLSMGSKRENGWGSLQKPKGTFFQHCLWPVGARLPNRQTRFQWCGRIELSVKRIYFYPRGFMRTFHWVKEIGPLAYR